MSDEKRFVYTRFFLVRMSYCFRLFTMIIYNMFVTHVRGYGTVLQYEVLVIMKYCEYHINEFGLSLSAVGTTFSFCYSPCRSQTVRRCVVQIPLCVTIRFATDNGRHLPTILLFKSIWQSCRNVRYSLRLTISMSFMCIQQVHRHCLEQWHDMYLKLPIL